ncbi:ergothioneine biosynthesis protein EgtC [Streptomyces sp. H10-C2]|uniref:ergothioneine biosynthesis protein EgtC n=1 Tax=unclassified Streptomyces TaxID=2593676 RepID=UPI0024BBA58B|nr:MULTISPECIES: ergothioneine biosynthesis protein EgtC [unclassified Streptomyces]MDJ0343553.1 ergothioneine biosynthesis protein EgtC [Streptomyces sp. PH10-H1]MDJ0368871.1 ergothioneine biosynthesis protein EgtC [Streptomyces sp. H10-C2]
MCRHLAYLGPPTALRTVLTEPEYSLYRQSWAPREQRHGTVNADGFGVGWYADRDPVPARYRRAGPIWADASFADLARVVTAGALLAAVRSATEGGAAGEAAAAPFTAGRWLFSHNGSLTGWPGTLEPAAARLSAAELLSLDARCDSAFVWALALHRLRAGEPQGDALAGTVADLAPHDPGRLNLLLTDGAAIAATAWGDTLYYRHEPGRSVLVASEPHDDQDDWIRVPDRTLLVATPDDVQLTTLKEPNR